jgi:hypothetical protein
MPTLTTRAPSPRHGRQRSGSGAYRANGPKTSAPRTITTFLGTRWRRCPKPGNRISKGTPSRFAPDLVRKACNFSVSFNFDLRRRGEISDPFYSGCSAPITTPAVRRWRCRGAMRRPARQHHSHVGVPNAVLTASGRVGGLDLQQTPRTRLNAYGSVSASWSTGWRRRGRPRPRLRSRKCQIELTLRLSGRGDGGDGCCGADELGS